MNSDNLYILIATVDNRASNLLDVLKDEQEQVFYVITHQILVPLDKKTKDVITKIKQRKDIVYFPLDNIKGVAKSRNNSLDYVHDGIALISDDDVLFCENTFESVKEAFELNLDADVITFKTLELSGRDYRLYPDKIFSHDQKSITGVGSIEIACRVEVIKKNKIVFDNDFGPGADKYPVGEDYILMADVLKKGLKAIFVPIAIVKHPEISTGLRFDNEIIYGRGAVFARVFGVKSLLIDIFYSFKKYKLYKHELSLMRYLYLMLKGGISYLKNSREKYS